MNASCGGRKPIRETTSFEPRYPRSPLAVSTRRKSLSTSAPLLVWCELLQPRYRNLRRCLGSRAPFRSPLTTHAANRTITYCGHSPIARCKRIPRSPLSVCGDLFPLPAAAACRYRPTTQPVQWATPGSAARSADLVLESGAEALAGHRELLAQCAKRVARPLANENQHLALVPTPMPHARRANNPTTCNSWPERAGKDKTRSTP